MKDQNDNLTKSKQTDKTGHKTWNTNNGIFVIIGKQEGQNCKFISVIYLYHTLEKYAEAICWNCRKWSLMVIRYTHILFSFSFSFLNKEFYFLFLFIFNFARQIAQLFIWCRQFIFSFSNIRLWESIRKEWVRDRHMPCMYDVAYEIK